MCANLAVVLHMISFVWFTFIMCSRQLSQALRIQNQNLDVEPDEKISLNWHAGFPRIYSSPDGATYMFDDDLDETVQLSKPIFNYMVPEPFKKGNFKESVIRKALHGDSIISKFNQCKINLIQQCSIGHGLMEVAMEPKSSTSFIHIFKNAGTTMNRAVLEHGGHLFTAWPYGSGAPLKEETPFLNDSLVPTLQNGYSTEFVGERVRDKRWLRAAFVRDPMKRVLSAFHEIEKKHEHTEGISHDELLARFVNTVDRLYSSPSLPCDSTPYGLDGVHFMLQTNFLINQFGVKHPIDYIGHSEHIEKELKYLLEDPKYKVEIHHGPNNQGADEAPKKFRLKESDLPLETKRKIWSLYKDDYCCLGMDFPKEAKQETDLDLVC